MHTEPEVHEGEILEKMPTAAPETSGAMVPQSEGAQLMQLAQMAMSQGKIAEMREILALKREYEADEARKAFVAAMADFKAEAGAVTIAKNKHVSFTTQKGKTEYWHAELHDITRALVPIMARHGLSHAWTFRQDKGITVGCIITHRNGHKSDPVEMTAQADDSGGKNTIQSIASTKTYLERYTLLAATGMATGGEIDNDGRAFEAEPEIEFITEEQEIVIRDLMDAYVKNETKFMAWISTGAGFEVTKLSEIPARIHDTVLSNLKQMAKDAGHG